MLECLYQNYKLFSLDNEREAAVCIRCENFNNKKTVPGDFDSPQAMPFGGMLLQSSKGFTRTLISLQVTTRMITYSTIQSKTQLHSSMSKK